MYTIILYIIIHPRLHEFMSPPPPQSSFTPDIDYIFVSKGWKVQSALVRPSSFPRREDMGEKKWAKECYPNEHWPSDHLLVEAIISTSPSTLL